jgi:hypothetical protein
MLAMSLVVKSKALQIRVIRIITPRDVQLYRIELETA